MRNSKNKKQEVYKVTCTVGGRAWYELHWKVLERLDQQWAGHCDG